MPEASGKFGVGCKSIWSDTGTHLLVYYPIDRNLYDRAMKNEAMRMPWRVFDDRHKLACAKYEARTTTVRLSGVLHLFDHLTVAAMKDGPIEKNIRSLVPYIFHHGFG